MECRLRSMWRSGLLGGVLAGMVIWVAEAVVLSAIITVSV